METKPDLSTLNQPSLPPTTEDWQAYQKVITKLYIGRDLTLKHVMVILEKRFGFRATTKMYKSHFTRWGIKKNISRSDKETAAQMIKQARDKGELVPKIVLDGRHIALDRVRRHCKSQKIFEEICGSLPDLPQNLRKRPTVRDLDVDGLIPLTPEELLEVQQLASALRSLSSNPARVLTNARDLKNFEKMLSKTKEYTAWHSDALGSKASQHKSLNVHGSCTNDSVESEKTRRFYYTFESGLLGLSNGTSIQGWRDLNEGCAMAGEIFKAQHRDVLSEIYGVLCFDDWNKFPEARLSIVQFLAQVCSATLGKYHPLSVILHLSRVTPLSRMLMEVALKVMLEVSQHHPSYKDIDTANIKRSYCRVLMENKNYDAAQKVAQEAVLDPHFAETPNNESTRRALRQLARAYFLQKRYDLAKTTCEDLLRRSRADLGNDFPDDVSVWAYQHLALICEDRRDCSGSETYWRLAFDGAVKVWGAIDYNTAYTRREMERNLTTHKNEAEKEIRRRIYQEQ